MTHDTMTTPHAEQQLFTNQKLSFTRFCFILRAAPCRVTVCEYGLRVQTSQTHTQTKAHIRLYRYLNCVIINEQERNGKRWEMP